MIPATKVGDLVRLCWDGDANMRPFPVRALLGSAIYFVTGSDSTGKRIMVRGCSVWIDSWVRVPNEEA